MSITCYPVAGATGATVTGGKTFKLAADGTFQWAGKDVWTAGNKPAGQANGFATLDGSGLVPLSQMLPSYNGSASLPSYPPGSQAGRLAWESSLGQLVVWDGSAWKAAVLGPVA